MSEKESCLNEHSRCVNGLVKSKGCFRSDNSHKQDYAATNKAIGKTNKFDIIFPANYILMLSTYIKLINYPLLNFLLDNNENLRDF